jgi:hypothetical protein
MGSVAFLVIAAVFVVLYLAFVRGRPRGGGDGGIVDPDNGQHHPGGHHGGGHHGGGGHGGFGGGGGGGHH